MLVDMSETPVAFMIATFAVLIAFFVVDLFVIGRKPHVPSTKECVQHIAFFVVMALIFGGLVWCFAGSKPAIEFYSGWLTEYSLSIDNLFVFVIIMSNFAVPKVLQKYVLSVGITVALILRGCFILVGAAIVQRFTWVFFLFGAFLIYTAIKLVVGGDDDEEYHENGLIRMLRKVIRITDDYDGEKLRTEKDGKSYWTPMLIVFLTIGTTDVMFAFDSIPAIFGLTKDPFIVFTSNVFALLGLQQLYFLLGALLDKLVYLPVGLAFVLGFIGIKLVMEALSGNTLPFINGGHPVSWVPEVPTWVSLVVIVVAMVDLQGPKIRCGWFKKNAEGEDKVQLEEGQEFIITTDDVEGDEHITSTTFKGLPGDCHPGDPILIDDGKVRLEVTKVEGNNVHTKVVVAGPVSSHKGINLPGVAVSLPALTEKDEADLRWAIRTGADIIAMSFVRFATDIDRAHEIMDEEGRRIPIVAKIEKPQALENLEDIVKTFDGVMAARGDMAVECPLEEVPLATKRIIELARQYAKPVIVATEVLGSMVHSPVPSRAEASDCANAVLDGADATMTSNETAVGEYPTETVATMSRISGFATEHGFDRIPELKNLDMSSTGAVSSAAVDLAEKLNAKAIVAYTQTGNTVHRVSRERPAAPIYGLTTNEHTYHWLALSWGTEAFLLDEDYHDKTRKDLMAFTDKVLKNAGKVSDGDKIVVLSSAQGEHAAGSTDTIYVHTVGAND